MSIYITKDIHETLDYVFIRTIEDNITSVSYTQDNAGGLSIISCAVNTGVITDSDGNEYPAGRAIVLWCSGGNINTSEKVRIQYNTAGGRVLDEEVVFQMREVA